jgi:hypothetical protein
MKRLINILAAITLGLVGLVSIILFLPVAIIWTPFNYYFDWKREKELEKYLNGLGDKNFFCYNNRTDAKDFIEKELIPKLCKDIELIYLDGREPKSNYLRGHISLALYKLKNYSGFPHLLKIRDGQIIDESVNNEFFNTMTHHKPSDKLLRDINLFFDLSVDNKNAT